MMRFFRIMAALSILTVAGCDSQQPPNYNVLRPCLSVSVDAQNIYKATDLEATDFCPLPSEEITSIVISNDVWRPSFNTSLYRAHFVKAMVDQAETDIFIRTSHNYYRISVKNN